MTDQPCTPLPAPDAESPSPSVTTGSVAPSPTASPATKPTGKPVTPKRKPKRRKVRKPAKAKTAHAKVPHVPVRVPGSQADAPATQPKPADTQAQPGQVPEAPAAQSAGAGAQPTEPPAESAAQREVSPAPQPPVSDTPVATAPLPPLKLKWNRHADPKTMDPRVVQYLPAFAWHLCGLRPYPAQEAVLADLSQPYAEVAACCANGVGKTTMLAAPTTLWHAMTFKNSVTITTSGVFRQVKEQMWPQIHNLARQFKGLVDIELNNTDFRIPATNSRVVGFSTDDPGKFEGWHADSLLIILDEAKTIPDPIFEAVERCKQGQPMRVLMLSSPGASTGWFYESIAGKQRHLWKRHTIRADQCPHIDPKGLERLIARFGSADHPHVKSQWFAEFMDVGAHSQIIPRPVLDQTIKSPAPMVGKERVAFCDFAAGGDENVFALREGNRLVDMVYWNDRNTMAAVGRFLQIFRRHGLDAGQVYGDGSGIGISMCDRFDEVGFRIMRVNNGSTADEEKLYTNRGAEMWHNMSSLMLRGEVNLGPYATDPILCEQLVNRHTRVDSKGRLGWETKDEMRKRGVNSPDRADAVIGAFTNSAVMNVAYRGFCGGQSLSELLEAQVQQDQMAGFDAGY